MGKPSPASDLNAIWTQLVIRFEVQNIAIWFDEEEELDEKEHEFCGLFGNTQMILIWLNLYLVFIL